MDLACVMQLCKNANHIHHCLIYIFVYIMLVDKTEIYIIITREKERQNTPNSEIPSNVK